MWAGILDSMRGAGDDVSSFFDNALVQGLGSAYVAGSKKTETKEKKINYMPVDNVRDITKETEALDSEDFQSVEIEWMKRLERFAGLNAAAKDSQVQLGK